jgi:hypothetical protein
VVAEDGEEEVVSDRTIVRAAAADDAVDGDSVRRRRS